MKVSLRSNVMYAAAVLVVPSILALSLASSGRANALAQENHAVSDAIRERIMEAAPSAAAVTPLKARKLLVFNLSRGFVHGSIPIADAAFTILGEKTGAYETVVTNDPRMFLPDRLAEFDAILLNNTTGTLFEDKALQASLLDFVKSGKGIAGVHAATDCFYDWEDFGMMMGGYFDGHPWNEEVTIKLDDPHHPLNAAFEGKPLVIADEIYQFRDPYDRDALRILLSLDSNGTNFEKRGMKRQDGDYAVSWVRSYGKGRVFYCSLGHRNEIFWNPKVLRHYLDGIQFALGDLPADTMPSTEWEKAGRPDSVGPGVSPDMSLAEALAGTAGYTFGMSREPLSALAEYVRLATFGSADDRRMMEQELISLLASPDATLDAQRFACRQLAVIGGNAAVDVLVPKLNDENLSDMARLALEGIPTSRVDAALSEALPDLNGPYLIGVLNTIAGRGHADAQKAIRDRISDDMTDDELAAAIHALGRIGDSSASIKFIRDTFDAHADDAESTVGRAVMQAMLSMADRLSQTDPWGAAFEASWEMYNDLYTTESLPRHVRASGFIGSCRHFSSNPATINRVLELLRDGQDPWWQQTSARMIAHELPGDPATIGLSDALVDRAMTSATRVRLIHALTERGRDQIIDRLITVLTKPGPDDTDEVQIAAMQGMGRLGGIKCVLPLLTIASEAGNQHGRSDAVVQAAQAALDQLHGADTDLVNSALIRGVMGRNPAIQAECARSLGVRGARLAADPIASLLAHDDPALRRAAWRSLEQIADERQLNTMVANYCTIPLETQDEELVPAAAAVSRVCAGVKDPDATSLELIEFHGPTSGSDSDARFLDVLAWLGGNQALDAARTFLRQTTDPDVRAAAVRALCSWKDAAPLEDVFAIASGDGDAALRAPAFQGYLRLLSLPSSRSARMTAALYKRAVPLAVNDDEHRMLLAGLSGVRHELAAEVAESYLSKESLRDDGARCMIRVAGSFGDLFAEQALDIISRAVAACPDSDEVTQLAGETVNHIERRRDYIADWQYAGPCTRDKTGGGELFDVAFKPEPGGTEGAELEWQAVPDSAVVEGMIVDFLKFIPGNDACAYIKTGLWSGSNQEVRLEVGSDDGVKVWLNNEIVHANNVMRGLTPGQDVFTGHLRKGWNSLLLKITQGGGDWRASCRVRSPDGFHFGDLKVDSAQQGN